MPNHVHGTHVFHPWQQSFCTIANQSFASGSNMAMHRNTSNDLLSGDSSDGEQAAPLIPQSTPQHLPISTSSTSFVSHQSKCKYSTFDNGNSMSVKSGSLISSHDKHQCNTGASSLYSLGAKMDKMNNTFANGFAQESKAHSHPETVLHCAGQKLPKASKGLTKV